MSLSSAHRPVLLVIEPAPRVREMLACRLRLAGYPSTTLADFQQAEIHLHEHATWYRAILVDVSGAHLSVELFLNHLSLWCTAHRLTPPAVIGLTTGSIPEGLIEQHRLLEKPLDFAYLYRLLQEIFAPP